MSEFDTDVSTERAQSPRAGLEGTRAGYDYRYVAGSDEPLDVAIPYAVASAAGVDPVDLEPRLFQAIDPDALEALLAEARPGTRITFELGEYEVAVTARREVYVIGT